MSVRQRLSGGTTQTDGQARNFVKAALTDVLRSGRGQTGPIVLAGDKERRKIWPDPVGRRNRTARPGLAGLVSVSIRACSRSRP